MSLKPVKNRHLAEGEVTGHFHGFTMGSECEVLVDSETDQMFVKATGPATLDHQEHGPITIDKGVYKVNLQNEYTPRGIERVRD